MEEKEHDRKFNFTEKEKLVEQISGKNIRDTREQLNQMRTEPKKNATINIKIDADTMKKLNELRGKLGSKKDDLELIAWLISDKLKKLEQDVQKTIAKEEEKNKLTQNCNYLNNHEDKIKSHSRYINPKLRKLLLFRASGRCEFISKITGRRCEETRNLHIDHANPYALSQDNSIENLRVYCSSHNAFSALRTYGHHVMDKYINSKIAINNHIEIKS
ncbi:MAG: hypothetical protein HQK49_16390 [Oligoflexia bacterium]|nr:hypothetical protein [Oligoflexia bacterium]